MYHDMGRIPVETISNWRKSGEYYYIFADVRVAIDFLIYTHLSTNRKIPGYDMATLVRAFLSNAKDVAWKPFVTNVEKWGLLVIENTLLSNEPNMWTW